MFDTDMSILIKGKTDRKKWMGLKWLAVKLVLGFVSKSREFIEKP